MKKYIEHILKINDFGNLLQDDNFILLKEEIDLIIINNLSKDKIIKTKPVVNKLFIVLKDIYVIYGFEIFVEFLNWLLITIKDIELTSVSEELYNISDNSYKIYNDVLLYSEEYIKIF